MFRDILWLLWQRREWVDPWGWIFGWYLQPGIRILYFLLLHLCSHSLRLFPSGAWKVSPQLPNLGFTKGLQWAGIWFLLFQAPVFHPQSNRWTQLFPAGLHYRSLAELFPAWRQQMEKISISSPEEQGGWVRWAVRTHFNFSTTAKFPAGSLMQTASQFKSHLPPFPFFPGIFSTVHTTARLFWGRFAPIW